MTQTAHRFLPGGRKLLALTIQLIELAVLSAINIAIIFSLTGVLNHMLRIFGLTQSGMITMASLMITVMLVWWCNRHYVLWRVRKKKAQKMI
ncbi:hypothetical protein [Paraburkholderia caffeinilytica]|uniref:hypothetical protein n=1 Tax=Paraburkholderia caffeinilytica TaxID=1761016 RepID=UPI003D9FC61E